MRGSNRPPTPYCIGVGTASAAGRPGGGLRHGAICMDGLIGGLMDARELLVYSSPTDFLLDNQPTE